MTAVEHINCIEAWGRCLGLDIVRMEPHRGVILRAPKGHHFLVDLEIQNGIYASVLYPFTAAATWGLIRTGRVRLRQNP